MFICISFDRAEAVCFSSNLTLVATSLKLVKLQWVNWFILPADDLLFHDCFILVGVLGIVLEFFFCNLIMGKYKSKGP